MHGECIDNKCICFKGFVGRDCDTRTCGGDIIGSKKFASSKTRKATGNHFAVETVFAPLAIVADVILDSLVKYVNLEHVQEIALHSVCLNGTCLCADGYVGNMCQDKLCHAECEKHGECNNGTCVCDPGYGGKNCQVALCPKIAPGKVCEHDGRYRCNLGYGGIDCSEAMCLKNCNGHGTCGTCEYWCR